MAVDKECERLKGAVVLLVAFGSAQQVVLAAVQLLVDFPLESANGIAENVVGFGSALGVSVAIVQQIASRFELGVDVLVESPVLAQIARQQADVCFAAVVHAA